MECLQERYRDVGTNSFAVPKKESNLVSNANGQFLTVTYPNGNLDRKGVGSIKSMRIRPSIEPAIIQVTTKIIKNAYSAHRGLSSHTSTSGDRITFFAGISTRKRTSTLLRNPYVVKDEVEKLTKAIDVLSPELHDRLDQNALERLELFKNYKDGWNDGAGKKLSKESIACLEMFLRVHKEKIKSLSVFLTLNGNLELLWKDDNGYEVELEFYPDKISSFIGAYNIESDFQLSEIDKLIDKL